MFKGESNRIGCGGQCPIHGVEDDIIGFIPNEGKLFGRNSSVKVAKGTKLKWDTYIIYMSPYWSFDGYHNLCPSSSEGCRSTCLVTSGQLKNPSPKQAQLDKTAFWLNDPNGFLSMAHKEIFNATKNKKRYSGTGRKFCVRMNGTTDIPWEKKSYVYKGVKYPNIMSAFPNVQFYDYTKIYSRLGNVPDNYHLTFSASENNTKQWEEALYRGFQVAMVFGSLGAKVDRKTGAYKREPGIIPKSYHGFKVLDGDDTDLTFLQPDYSKSKTRKDGVILGLRSKGKAENDLTGFVKRDFAGSLQAKINPRTNIPNVISPRSKSPRRVKISRR